MTTDTIRFDTIEGGPTASPDPTALETSIAGRVITERDADYDEARRLWNGVFDHRPAAIVRCVGTGDVVEAVRFASTHRLLTAVRGGGHNVAGTAGADGALVIDLGPMHAVEVDAERRRARVGGGATWADVDVVTQRHGLATPGGVVSDTGVGGLTLGGGIGWLRRRHGLSCDNLLGAEIVTAGGDIIHTSEREHSELLWGLRGGGGNFGVVTSMEFRLHPVGPEVEVALVFHHGAHTVQGLRSYRDYTQQVGDDVSSFAICGTIPQEDPFPEDAWGEPYLLFMAVHAGSDLETARSELEPLRSLSEPIVDLSGSMPYVEVQQALDEDYPTGMRYHWKSLDLPGLGDDVIDRIATLARHRPSPLSTIDIWHQGGEMGRVDPTATAFGDRSAPYLLGIESNWTDAADDDSNIRWTRDVASRLEPLSTGREYLNFPGFMEDGNRTVRTAYGENLRRLVGLKRRYDPDNLFRLHQNIDPDTAV